VTRLDTDFNPIAHNLSVGQAVSFYSTTNDPPAPFVEGQVYYVVEIYSANSFKVSNTPGGSVIDITDIGSGIRSYQGESQTNSITFTHNLGYYAPFIVSYNGSTTLGQTKSYFMSDSLQPLNCEMSTTTLKINVDSLFDQGFSNNGDTVYFTAYVFLDDFTSYTADNILSADATTVDNNDYGFAVSKDGFDVKTCDKDDLVLSSEFFTNTVHKKGTQSSSTSIVHGLDYFPAFLSYTKYSGDSFLSIDPYSMILDDENATFTLGAGDVGYYVIFKT
jgi:hypothetical protein